MRAIERVLAEARVEAEDHLAQQEVAEGVEAVALAHRQRRDHVAKALRDLARVDVPVAMDVQVAVGGQAERAQHRRPEDRVRLQDVLADEVLGAGPERRELRPVGIADPGEIVDQRVEPHVADEAAVEGQLDAPLEARLRPRDAEVAEPAGVAQHAERLVAVALGADEVRVLLDVLREPAEVAAHLEEVVRLAATLGRALVVAAQAVLHVALGEEALATDAVEALVLAEVDLALLPEPLQHGLHDAHVIRVGGADEAIEGEAELLPGGAEGLRVLVGDLLRRRCRAARPPRRSSRRARRCRSGRTCGSPHSR